LCTFSDLLNADTTKHICGVDRVTPLSEECVAEVTARMMLLAREQKLAMVDLHHSADPVGNSK